MRIGVDFDNTLVSYDELFHRVAQERGLIPPALAASKRTVRDHLRNAGREDIWTEIQGYVYGARMAEAAAYPGAIEFLSWARSENIALAIVSHKTRHPFAGPAYDLHEAARGWIRAFLTDGPSCLIDGTNIFFELTKEEKIKRISTLELDFFIDDLPEIFLEAAFPRRTARLLFDPEGSLPAHNGVTAFGSWELLRRHIESQWTRAH